MISRGVSAVEALVVDGKKKKKMGAPVLISVLCWGHLIFFVLYRERVRKVPATSDC